MRKVGRNKNVGNGAGVIDGVPTPSLIEFTISY
jgi:hypothetical protein